MNRRPHHAEQMAAGKLKRRRGTNQRKVHLWDRAGPQHTHTHTQTLARRNVAVYGAATEC